MNNLWSYCGLVDARISASEKDLTVLNLLKGGGGKKMGLKNEAVYLALHSAAS